MLEENCLHNDEDYIFLFNTKKGQMLFEFWFLVSLFFLGVLILFLNALNVFLFDTNLRNALYSGCGGFLGGWVFVTKWFYRVTAKGRNNQKNLSWEPHKIYWRIFTPFLSSIIAVAIYCITVANIIPFITLNKESAHASFGFAFLVGYFSDIMLSKIFNWISFMWGGKESKEEKYCG